jgi:signal transduction histidine kinase
VAFFRKWAHARGLERAQLQHLGIGVFLLAAGGTTTNLLLPIATGTSQYSWLGPYFTLPLIVLVTHAIIRHRLLDLRLIVNRGLAYSLAIAAVSAATLGLARAAALHTAIPPIRADLLLAFVIGLAMLTAPLQRVLDRLIDPYLYRNRFDHASALRDATHRLGRLMEPLAFAEELRALFAETLVPVSVTVLLPARDDKFDCLYSELPEEATHVVKRLAPHIATEYPRLVTLLSANAYDNHTRIRELRSLGVEVVVTLRRRRDVVGIALLGPRRSGDAYFAHDLAFVESVAELAGIAIENTTLYRQRVHMLEYSKRLLESLESAVVAIDPAGAVTNFNPAATQLLGLDQAPNRKIDALPSEIAWALALAVRGVSIAKDEEVFIDHSTRGTVPVVVSTAVLRSDAETVVGALLVATDLSTVKNLERNQRRLEHLTLMARFYAGIAHEIRNPLAAISNLIAMLPDHFDDPEYRDIATRLLPTEVSRIVGLADRLRLMAPSVAGTLAPVQLAPLLADIVALHAPHIENAEPRIELRCENDLPAILGDSNQLVQLFVNLIRNGLEAMPNGGRVLVRAYVDGHTRRAVLAQVLDEGPGLSLNVRSRVFEPFFTTKPNGTGLGLTICREIATFHGATLTLGSRSDRRGAVATIEFPCMPEQETPVITESHEPATA